MSALCTFTCGGGVDALPVRYDDPCVITKRSADHATFNLIQCDVSLDLTDKTAVDASVAADEIECSPFGTIVFQAPTFENVDLGCGRVITGDLTYNVDYNTYIVQDVDALEAAAVDDQSEYDYFNDLWTKSPTYNWLSLDCNGMAYYEDGTNPGFKYTLSVPPYWIEGDAELGNWVMQFQLESTDIIGPRYVHELKDSLCTG